MHKILFNHSPLGTTALSMKAILFIVLLAASQSAGQYLTQTAYSGPSCTGNVLETLYIPDSSCFFDPPSGTYEYFSCSAGVVTQKRCTDRLCSVGCSITTSNSTGIIPGVCNPDNNNLFSCKSTKVSEIPGGVMEYAYSSLNYCPSSGVNLTMSISPICRYSTNAGFAYFRCSNGVPVQMSLCSDETCHGVRLGQLLLIDDMS